MYHLISECSILTIDTYEFNINSHLSHKTFHLFIYVRNDSSFAHAYTRDKPGNDQLTELENGTRRRRNYWDGLVNVASTKEAKVAKYE